RTQVIENQSCFSKFTPSTPALVPVRSRYQQLHIKSICVFSSYLFSFSSLLDAKEKRSMNLGLKNRLRMNIMSCSKLLKVNFWLESKGSILRKRPIDSISS